MPHRFRRRALARLAGAAVLGVLTSPAQAELNFNAGAKLSYDNNVNGSPTSANEQGDTSLAASASASYYKTLDAAQSLYLIGQVGATATGYKRFGNLNTSMLLGSGGLYKQLSPTWSAQVTGRAFALETRQSARDSDGFGVTLEVKNQLDPKLWVKAIVDYEDNDANTSTFSYTGPTYGLARLRHGPRRPNG